MTSNISTENITTSVEKEQIPNAPEAIKGEWTKIIPWVLIFVVFYFFLIRPQEKRRKEHIKLLDSLKVGDSVITSSGIYGKVVKKNDDDATVEIMISENTIIKLLRSAIAELPSRITSNQKLNKSNKKDEKANKTKK